MINRQAIGWGFLLFGLLFVVFNVPFARLQSKIDEAILKEKMNVKWYRIINVIGGSLTALAGIFALLKH